MQGIMNCTKYCATWYVSSKSGVAHSYVLRFSICLTFPIFHVTIYSSRRSSLLTRVLSRCAPQLSDQQIGNLQRSSIYQSSQTGLSSHASRKSHLWCSNPQIQGV